MANDIYFGNEDGFLYVIDVDNGTLRMAARTLSPANHDYPYQREQGCREKPIPDGADCRGKKIATEVVRHDDGVVFGTDAKQLYLYSTPSGGIEWVYEAQGNILGDIAVDDNLIIFAERGGTIVAIDTDESRNLRRKDTDDGEAFDRMRAEVDRIDRAGQRDSGGSGDSRRNGRTGSTARASCTAMWRRLDGRSSGSRSGRATVGGATRSRSLSATCSTQLRQTDS